LYAQLLFLFLGVPGVLLAALLAGVIGTSARERRRLEQALLRLRGANPRRIARFAAVEAGVVGGAGALLGIGGAALAGQLAFGTARFGADTLQAASWAAGAAAIGLTVAFVTILVPAIRDSRTTTVQQARAVVGGVSRPLWMRLYADVALLA